jgi:hypothetical protein
MTIKIINVVGDGRVDDFMVRQDEESVVGGRISCGCKKRSMVLCHRRSYSWRDVAVESGQMAESSMSKVEMGSD